MSEWVLFNESEQAIVRLYRGDEQFETNLEWKFIELSFTKFVSQTHDPPY